MRKVGKAGCLYRTLHSSRTFRTAVIDRVRREDSHPDRSYRFRQNTDLVLAR
jgi:hypothetical protein